MIGHLASRIGLMALMAAALIAAEPRLTPAFEQVGHRAHIYCETLRG